MCKLRQYKSIKYALGKHQPTGPRSPANRGSLRKFCLHPLAIAISAFALPSTAVMAQETSAAEEEVVVTGFRRSLQNSLNLKKEETSIVEAISAEDIGKLPDSSIAESLARLPGLAGDRRNGRTSGISVRGFNENYIGTMLNGRELLGVGDNRGVEFDLYPSEIISSAVVYKTPEANLMTQGIGGTVDLRTIRPLESDRIIAINANYEQNQLKSANPDFDDKGHRLSFIYSDKYAYDRVGLAIAIATTESPSQEEQFAAWGYDGNNTITAHDSLVRSAVLERDTFSGVLQFEPSDNLTITLDGLYINFEENDVKRGIEDVFTSVSNVLNAEGNARTGNEVAASGDFGDFHTVIRNDFQREEAELQTFGVNVDWAVNDNWTLSIDASHGESEKEIVDIETYSGVGRPSTHYVLDANGNIATDDEGNPITELASRPTSSGSFEMTSSGILISRNADSPDYTDRGLITLAGPQLWGNNLSPTSTFDPTYVNGVDSNGNPISPNIDDQLNAANSAQDGFVNAPFFEEELTNFRFTLNGEVDFSFINSLEFGFSYSDRSKTKDNNGFFITAPTWPGDAPIPDEVFVGTIDLKHIGDVQILGYDGLSLYDDGFYRLTDAGGDPSGSNRGLETGRLGDSYTVNEELLNVYVQAGIDTELGDVRLTGNIGVQVAQADQESSGWDTSTGPDLFVLATPVSGGDDYTKVLPSLNLNFEITEDFFIRTAISKTISRPRIDDMRPNNQVSFSFNDFNIQSTNPNQAPFSGSSGNPDLQPHEANQFDIAYEWYFADEGVASVAFFYKDLVNWTVSGASVADFSDFYIPGGFHDDSEGNPPATFQGVLTNRTDGLEGYVQGHELLLSFPFGVISESLDGLGITASATFSEGAFDDGSAIPGLSEEIFQVTAYYQKAGFDFRISGRKRDAYLSETRGSSLALTPLSDAGAELWDAQIGYDFAESGIAGLEGLAITLQAQNLTDEDTTLLNTTDPRLVMQHQSFGSNYLLGVNYKF